MIEPKSYKFHPRELTIIGVPWCAIAELLLSSQGQPDAVGGATSLAVPGQPSTVLTD
jgi:hypothetical protein